MQRIRTRTVKATIPDRRPRMRTIPQAYEEIKNADGFTALTFGAVDRIIREGKVPCVTVGRKRLVNMDVLERYLSGL